jgi:ABC-2 type transport system ATP-binding protein
MAGMRVLEVEGLTKVYRSRRRGDTTAVDDVSFSVAPGEIVGLLGPNGAGKTTTIKCISTLVYPTRGSITIDGTDAVARPRRAVAKVAALLEGNRNVYWRLTTKDNLEFFAEIQGISSRAVRVLIDELIERFGLASKRNTPARMLSKGMQQKLALACAFIKGTPLLLLDEPTLGLDVEASYELRQAIREMATEHGRTVVLSSHDMAVVQEVCERVIIISGGHVVTDDKVSNLIQLFRARAYTFTVSGVLSAEQRSHLEATFPMCSVETDHTHTVVDVEFPDGAGFYSLMDILRSSEVVVEAIDRRDPNLEEIFLRIVKGASA